MPPTLRLGGPSESEFPFTTAITYFARASGASRSGDVVAADEDVRQLSRIVDELKAAKDDYWAIEVEVERLGGAAWAAAARGERDSALKLMREAADMEDASDKAAVTPSRPLPARELLGDMLLQFGRPVEALAAHQGSETPDPKRFRTLWGAGQAAAAAGERDKARDYFARLVDMAGEGQRPELAKARKYLTSR